MVGGPTKAMLSVPTYGHIGASRSLIHSLHSRSSSETITGTLRRYNLFFEKPSSTDSTILAPPVYRTSTTPVRSESFLLLRRFMLVKYGASWSSVNSEIFSFCTNVGTLFSLTTLSNTGCSSPASHRSKPRW